MKVLPGFPSVSDLKSAWTNIRDTYTKMHRESNRSGSGAFQPKGVRRILIWNNANFLHSTVVHNKHCPSKGLPFQRPQDPLPPMSDDEILNTELTPQSQSQGQLHLPQVQPSRPGSSASVGTSEYFIVLYSPAGGDYPRSILPIPAVKHFSTSHAKWQDGAAQIVPGGTKSHPERDNGVELCRFFFALFLDSGSSRDAMWAKLIKKPLIIL